MSKHTNDIKKLRRLRRALCQNLELGLIDKPTWTAQYDKLIRREQRVYKLKAAAESR